MTVSKQDQIKTIARAILDDGVCPQLRDQATQLVIGDGDPESDIVFIGEAPGKQEDIQGLPFVGASGKFLTEMLADIGLKRQDVYITNIVKYRPPANRDPSPAEIKAFIPYLIQQIEIIQPKLIVFLGRHAMNVFLPELKISQVHGQPQKVNGQTYLPLYHPAAALYNGGMRQTLMQDFSRIPEIIKQI